MCGLDEDEEENGVEEEEEEGREEDKVDGTTANCEEEERDGKSGEEKT